MYYFQYTLLKNSINKAADKIIGKQDKPIRNEWFDEECTLILEEKNRAYKRMIGRYTRQNELEYKNKRREANHMFRNKKREWLHENLSNISTEYNNQNARHFYKEVNYFKKEYKPQTKLIKNNKGEIVSNEEQALEIWMK